MCVRVRACVCVYIYIIIYICLLVCWKIVEVGRELAPEPDFPCVFNCPTAELCCRQMILWRKGEEGNQPSQCAKWIPVASVLVLSITPVTSKQETAVWELVAARRNGNLFPKRALSLSVLRVGLVILTAWRGDQSQISTLSGSVLTHTINMFCRRQPSGCGSEWKHLDNVGYGKCARVCERWEGDWPGCRAGIGFTLAPLSEGL